ncbi:MAG: hypothetical protein IPG08_09120 [Sphingobacteriaceae bacterium]|nr:hypothetical protein [Sphingobacteriaceae bacterium]
MKIKNLIVIAALMMMFGVVKAQTNVEWTPILVSMDGTNTFKGVEAYYSLSNCGGSDVVIIKLKNTNDKAVKAQWVNAIVSNDEKEHYGKTKLVSVSLKATSESVGACNTKATELIVKLSDYGVTLKEFKTIVGSSFYVE